mmetsp:Transcript_11993/g.24688  ORF Transcript_11993/g.24688 Transcript_11993/m.24688 type:complete len:83 (+) Transcript_11993:29-277(+)|eukprot:CAMPEP_0202823810 /NCGR_PEP_ID=MMETSP1389-20130828/11934_1 /ASSEMBLY_ACC=CAM_ASM_000865 /TAXON_ID=302021 /ORGANISM="Rhodomonas sp., Strain CCMP768" /LENGTH=82 /DNA_ID=CAMNT_0049496827 /DNA_START=32 /DNA_END=280 /DNA_ORIENTATION=-
MFATIRQTQQLFESNKMVDVGGSMLALGDGTFALQDYADVYETERTTYMKAAEDLKLATGPYQAARDAYVAATATYTKEMYE